MGANYMIEDRIRTDQDLFDKLSELVENNDSFYKTLILDSGGVYTIFNYRLVSFSDFNDNLPHSLEARGIMFFNYEGFPPHIVSRPMEKFFNISENPFTMDLKWDTDDVESVMFKMDGSLISTYLTPNGELKLKSKNSLTSDQAIQAMEWLEQNPEFKSELQMIAEGGETVNMEWTGPNNIIVVAYPKHRLTVLNIRNNTRGTYRNKELFFKFGFIEIYKHWVETMDAKYFPNIKKFIDSIPCIEDNIEGFVIERRDGQKVKIKTDKYKKLHHVKDGVNHPKRLFEAIIFEAVDDLKSLFKDEPVHLDTIGQMEDKVIPIFNSIVSVVETFYKTNKHLSRKDYAIKMKTVYPQYSSLIMNLYLEREVDYKTFAIKNIDMFGII
jgi:T4 RnlA family RNA ligase